MDSDEYGMDLYNESFDERFGLLDDSDREEEGGMDDMFFEDEPRHEIKAFERVYANPFELQSFNNFTEVNELFDRKLDEITISDIKVNKFVLLLEERGITGIDTRKVQSVLHSDNRLFYCNILALILGSYIIGKDGYVTKSRFTKIKKFIKKYSTDGLDKILVANDVLRYAKLFEIKE